MRRYKHPKACYINMVSGAVFFIWDNAFYGKPDDKSCFRPSNIRNILLFSIYKKYAILCLLY